MEREEHQELVMRHFGNPVDDVDQRALGEALYTVGELGLFHDSVDSMSVEQALQTHRIVEVVRKSGFPGSLRM